MANRTVMRPMTSGDLKVEVATQIFLRLNISKTAKNRGLVSMEHL